MSRSHDKYGTAAAVLSHRQERFHILGKIFPDRPPTHYTRAFELTGPLDHTALIRALNETAVAGPALRSRYTGLGPIPVQVFDAEAATTFTDLSGQPPAKARGFALSAARVLAESRFDRTAEGPWRSAIYRIRPDLHLVVLVFDSAVMDDDFFAHLWQRLVDCYLGHPATAESEDFATELYRQRTADRTFDGNLVTAPPTVLPHDFPPTTSASWATGELSDVFGRTVLDRARVVAKNCSTGVEAVGLSALVILLTRFCRTTEPVLGILLPDIVPTRVRAPRRWGLPHDALPFSLDVSGEPSLVELVDRTAAAATKYPHGSGLQWGAETEQPNQPRDLGRPPLFAISFNAGRSVRFSFPRCRLRTVAVASEVLETDLAVRAHHNGRSWQWSWRYRTGLYRPQTIDNLAGAFQTLLPELLASPDRPVSRCGRTAPHAAASVPVPPGASLVDAFREVAARRPDDFAVTLGDERLDYGELDRWSDAIAGWLLDRTRCQETGIGVVARRDIGVIAVILGILKADHPYVPLPADSRTPPPHEGIVLDPADPPVRRPGRQPVMRPRDSAGGGADSLLARFSTSGSTGIPKVVCTVHRGVQHYRDYLQTTWRLCPDDTVLQMAALTFDASIRDLLCPIAAGARIRMLEDGDSRDPYAILDTIAAEGVTAILAIVPSVLAALVAAAGPEVPGLRLILVSGEPLTAELAQRVRRWAPHARLVNQYGVTECTMTSAYHEVTDEDLADGSVPIGRMIDDTYGYVLDDDGEPLPDGALGELYLAGAGVTRGYTSAALTAERFLPDPFGPSGSRMYRTGDLVRRSAGGLMRHHGRSDKQVKVRGVRVELDACEAALWRCPGVREAAVVLRDGDLVAYVVGDVSGSEIRRDMAQRVPAAMVPNRYVRMRALPLTSTGKIDRRRLPDHRGAGVHPGFVGARDVAEVRVRACWADVLGRAGIGVQDDFFALGGTPVTLLSLVAEFRRRFGVAVAPLEIVAAPTIEELCAHRPELGRSPGTPIVRLSGGSDERPAVVLVPDETGGAARYQPLADQIGAGVPVAAVEAVGRARGERPLASVHDMAGTYARQIYESTPAPVTLMGWGFGARVATAAADHLERFGAPPRLLVLVHPVEGKADGATAAARYATAVGLPPLTDLDDDAALSAILRQERKRLALPPSTDLAAVGRMVAVFATAEAAGRAEPATFTTHADVLHVRGRGSAHPPVWVSSDGTTEHVTLEMPLAPVPGPDELAAVGDVVGRHLRGVRC